MKIVLDAGHGYNTAGKRVVDGSMREWEFNNATALKAKALLQGYEGVEVLLTADVTGKTDVPLKERTNKANAWKADVLVSIHANASGSVWTDAHGLETFVYKMSSDKSVALAKNVEAALVKETGLRDRGVKEDNLHMLRESKMPAILVECGFMSNKEEAELLKTDAHRSKCAKAIVDGLVQTYGLKKKVVVVKPTPPKAQTKPSVKDAVIGTATVTTGALNVRKSNSFTSAVVKSVKQGTVFNVYAVKGGMLKVNGGLWITGSSKYIKLKKH